MKIQENWRKLNLSFGFRRQYDFWQIHIFRRFFDWKFTIELASFQVVGKAL